MITNLNNTQRAILNFLESSNVTTVKYYDIGNRIGIVQFAIIASVRHSKQMSIVCQKIKEFLDKAKINLRHSEVGNDWSIFDCADCFVMLIAAEFRDALQIDELYSSNNMVDSAVK